MPILPTPSPTTQHLIPPPSRPRGRVSGIVNTAIGLIALVLILVLGTGWLTSATFFLSRFHLQAGVGTPGPALYFQGFQDLWLRSSGDHQFMKPDSKRILLSEADDYHMNAVAIVVTADQSTFHSTSLSYSPTDPGNTDSLSDADIEQAITDAEAANLTPILTLEIRVTNEAASTLPNMIGNPWYNTPGNIAIYSTATATAEHQWFDSYTAFAVHYAQLSQKYHLPYFIFGNDLVNMTTDTKATPGANGSPGDKFTCNGRRDCEWRHVINAIKSPTYTDFQGQQQTGGGYQGKLIYGASWSGDDQDNAPVEFEHITWWDAVDIIGVNAYFPIMKIAAADTIPIPTLIDAWHGKQDDPNLELAGQGDIIGRLNAMVEKFKHPILFTSVGYESTPGANNAPGATPPTTRDDLEQAHDMQALLCAFSPQAPPLCPASTPQTAPWFVGAIWSFDAPKWPRSSVAGWATSTEWAGDTVTGSGANDAKAGGKFLAQFYQPRPVSEA